ncbi:MAG: phosphatase family protein [Ferruginibacter sp.]|nr:phosphatase family protein [Ferruginibacter sp.]
MLLKKIFCYSFLFISGSRTFCQSLSTDSNHVRHPCFDTATANQCQEQYFGNYENIYIYTRPKLFKFITNLPKDAVAIARSPFNKASVRPLLLIAGSTVLLLFADQAITDGVHQFSNNIHFHSEEEYKDVLSFPLGKQKVSLLKLPKNLNTGFYQAGQGFPSLLIGAGLYAYGSIHKDYRAVSTASQLVETFILMGVATQLLKRITGRQSPSEATVKGGNWHFFPSFKNFQSHTPNFDAFPSGHLATLISSVTVLAENYSEKRWIKPVGYGITGLVGYAMINNKVHWASDYPLAIALGYLCGREVVKNNRKVISRSSKNKYTPELSCSFNYSGGRFMPEIIYNF